MDKDPAQMSDEELDQQIESGSELDQSPSAPTEQEPTVPETPEVPPETPAVPEAPEIPEPEVEEVQQPEPAPAEKPSRRENLRIQQIIERAKQGAYTPPPLQPTNALDYSQALEADPETIKALEADRQSYAKAQSDEVLKQVQAVQFRTALEIDAPKVESKYPQFDKDSEDFNPAVANAINQWYLSTAGFDPASNTVQNTSVRYADFVEGVMELAEAAAGAKVEKTSKNIAKQAASTGLRPDGSSAKRLNLNQAPQNMSDEELDAIIAQAIPKR